MALVFIISDDGFSIEYFWQYIIYCKVKKQNMDYIHYVCFVFFYPGSVIYFF